MQVPSAATVFCQPIQMRTGSVHGLNFEQANMWRWRADYEGIDLSLQRCSQFPIQLSAYLMPSVA